MTSGRRARVITLKSVIRELELETGIKEPRSVLPEAVTRVGSLLAVMDSK
jgi:hypothetical protein